MEDFPVTAQKRHANDEADMSLDQTILQAVEGPPLAGPSTGAAHSSAKRNYHKKHKKVGHLTSYTVAFVPGVYNIKNPAGDYVQRDTNVEVARQVSQVKARRAKEAADAEKQRSIQEGGNGVPDIHRLSHILILHPGSRNLRIGRASDFYPKEVPNCIARPVIAANRGQDPPVPGSRAKRLASEHSEARRIDHLDSAENGDVKVNRDNDEDTAGVDPVDIAIGYLRDYLRTRLRQNKLATDSSQAARVVAGNTKSKPEPVPEHNDPYRIDWTELDGRQYVVGTEALRLPESSGFRVRYPILNRSLNQRDWQSPQLLLDDIGIILQEALRMEMGISQREYPKYSVVLIVPDHGDRTYVEAMSHLLLSVMGFNQIAVHQEAYTAIFSAGLSSACVVDIGAQQTSVTCVDEGVPNADTRINLSYGGDDITVALSSIMQRSAFPYRDLDLSKSQQWLMMDNLKIKICTLEEHLVANTLWDFHLLRTEGLTQKYMFRTYDENILAPLCLFDIRIIDFEAKRGNGTFPFWNSSDDIDDMLTTAYDEPSGAMRACTAHLRPSTSAPMPVEESPAPLAELNLAAGAARPPDVSIEALGSSEAESEQVPAVQSALGDGMDFKPKVPSETPTPVPEFILPIPEYPSAVDPSYDIVYEASKVPLDAAIAASISMCVTENKIKAAASSILLIGGSAALKGLGAFLAERLPPLLRARGLPIPEVQIVPPPRNLNPRFVCWKGASVMCNLDSLSDMWIRRDEWDAIGARALKERCLFL